MPKPEVVVAKSGVGAPKPGIGASKSSVGASKSRVSSRSAQPMMSARAASGRSAAAPPRGTPRPRLQSSISANAGYRGGRERVMRFKL